MNREIHVRFWEGLGVRFPRATHSRVVCHKCCLKVLCPLTMRDACIQRS
jgi:hypothetical protein